MQARGQLDFTAVTAAGLLVAGLAGVGAAAGGAPFLTSSYRYAHWPVVGKVPLASAMVFDLGVFLTVLGATLLILTLLGAGGARTAADGNAKGAR